MNKVVFYPDYYRRNRDSIYLIDGFDLALSEHEKIILPSRNGRLRHYMFLGKREILFLFLYAINVVFWSAGVKTALVAAWLAKKGVREVVVICSYNRLTMRFSESLASKGLKVIELQHGHTTPSHVFYMRGLPHISEFWCWNDDYADVMKKFDSNLNVLNVGMPFESSRLTSKPAKIENLLIVDQWSIRDEMVQLTSELAKNYPKLAITYKLHPNKSFWPKGELFDKLPNVTELKSNIRITDMAMEYDAFLGQYSTGLIEASISNRWVFLTPDYVDDILLQNDFVRPFEELRTMLNQHHEQS